MGPPEAVWQRGLRWLELRREGFELPAEEPPELFRLKALGELASVCEVLGRAPLPEPALAALRRLLEFAWEQFGRGDVLARFLERQPYPVLGTMYAVFERLGWRHERTRERLEALGRPGALAAERRPARPPAETVAAQYGADGVAVLCLGLALAWESLGLASPWSRRRLFPLTWLARRPEAPALTVPEAYSLTHTVFFMTDWGAEPEGLGEAERSFLAAGGPRWMEGFRAAGNFDLYAELATALACAGLAPPAEVEAVLGAAQREDGSIPGPAQRVAERTRGIEDERRRSFVAAYHTTLAGTLASVAAGPGLGRGRAARAAAGG